MIELDFPDGPPMSQSFLAAAVSLLPAVEAKLRFHAYMLKTRVMANASGRPGPRRVTGDYLRSISAQPLGQYGGSGWFVGTNAPQGPRLEFGFVGVDSLGRHYDQPPYPHFGPAADWMEPLFAGAMEVVVQSQVVDRISA